MSKKKFEILSFNKLYNQIVYQLKKRYNKANGVFTTASPYGQILSVLSELFRINILNIQNVSRSFNLNDKLNDNTDVIRSLARVGQYNPSRGQSAFGTIQLKVKGGIDLSEIPNGKIIFNDKLKLINVKNNLPYILELNQDSLIFSVDTKHPISLSIVQGEWKTQTFTGQGTINQSITVNTPRGKQIDNFKFKVYVNSELWEPRTHKFDMLKDEHAYVPLTSFTGGLDILFGNGDEGMIPSLGSIIRVEYLVIDGAAGNIIDEDINLFTFQTQPKNIHSDDVTVDDYFDILIENKITFGSNGDTADYLKSILPYASSNFVLAGPDQYKFFLKRLNIFSIVDVYTSDKNSSELTKNIYELLKTNTGTLKTLKSDNTTMRELVNRNLDEVVRLRKMLLLDGNNIVNIFLMPDISVFYSASESYFNIDTNLFTLDQSEKDRILNYLATAGIQIISNEVKIIDPIIKRFAVNLTLSIFDDAVETNIINEITSVVSNYFIYDMRRDRIPPSDIVRLVDGIDGVDSVTVEFISEDVEKYHKEYIIKAKEYFIQNGKNPKNTDIVMNDGNVYDPLKVINIDPILGDILIDKEDLPLIRGGFTDRYNNFYNLQPSDSGYSPINVLILPNKTKRKNFK